MADKMVLLFDLSDYDERQLLILNKRILQSTMKDCLSDPEQWSLKQEIETIDKKLAMMDMAVV